MCDSSLPKNVVPASKANVDYHLRQIARHTKDARDALSLGGITLETHLLRIEEQVAAIRAQRMQIGGDVS
jgi:hypothetical protein